VPDEDDPSIGAGPQGFENLEVLQGKVLGAFLVPVQIEILLGSFQEVCIVVDGDFLLLPLCKVILLQLFVKFILGNESPFSPSPCCH
jgi:hypothetical protein